MESRIIRVFYNQACMPFKDKERSTHFPVIGSAFMGASNTTEIRFYTSRIGGGAREWIVIGKLPNGKRGFKLLGEAVLDEEIGENYYSFQLSQFFTQCKGDLFLSLGGYNGNEITLNEDEIYEMEGNPVIETTGAIKLNIAYATPINGSDEEIDNWQDFLAALGDKADKTQVIIQYETLSALESDYINYEDGQLFYCQENCTIYKKATILTNLYEGIGLFARAGVITSGTTVIGGKSFAMAEKRFCLMHYQNEVYVKSWNDGNYYYFVNALKFTNNSDYVNLYEKVIKIKKEDPNKGLCYIDNQDFDVYKKSYIDDYIPTLSGNNNFTGNNVFDNAPQTSATPSDNSDLTRKDYVDAEVGNVDNSLLAHTSNTNNPHSVTKAQVGLGNVTNDAQVKRSEMGNANGVATLDGNGKVPTSQLPDSILGQLLYGGTINVLSATEETEYNLADCGVVILSENAKNLLGATTVDEITLNGITCNSNGASILIKYSDLYSLMLNNSKAVGIYFVVNNRNKQDGYIGVYTETLVNASLRTYGRVYSNSSTGDWLVVDYAGTTIAYSKIDNTDAVTSVNGQTGAVSLDGNNLKVGGEGDMANETIEHALTETVYDLADEKYQPKILHTTLSVITENDWQQEGSIYKYTSEDLYTDLGLVNANDIVEIIGLDDDSKKAIDEYGIYIKNVSTTNGETYAYLESQYLPAENLSLSIVVTKQYTDGGQIDGVITEGDVEGSNTIEISNSKLEVKGDLVSAWNNKSNTKLYRHKIRFKSGNNYALMWLINNSSTPIANLGSGFFAVWANSLSAKITFNNTPPTYAYYLIISFLYSVSIKYIDDNGTIQTISISSISGFEDVVEEL